MSTSFVILSFRIKWPLSNFNVEFIKFSKVPKACRCIWSSLEHWGQTKTRNVDDLRIWA